MAGHARSFFKVLNRFVKKRHHAPKRPNPAERLANQYTGHYAFLDELTGKTHTLSIAPDLAIKIDGRVLLGKVTGISTTELTFLDHYGYQLIVTNGEEGPEAIFDEAENASYQVIRPHDEESGEN